MRRALALPYFVAPPLKTDFESPPSKEKNPNYSYRGTDALFGMTKYALILAWREARAGRSHEALRHIDFAVRTGIALENSHGDILPLMFGTAIHETSMREVNAMIDPGLLADDSYSELQRIFKNPAPSVENWKQLVKNLYALAKNIELEKDEMFKTMVKTDNKEKGYKENWFSKRVIIFRPYQVLKIMYPIMRTCPKLMPCRTGTRIIIV